MSGFGTYFRKCRKEAGMKQATAALLIGISQPSLSQYETDVYEPTVSTLMRMAEVYGCSIDHLCGLDTPEGGLIIRTIMRDGE